MTINEVKRLGKLWAKRLNLLDWSISYKLTDALTDNQGDVSNENARVLYWADHREADVTILREPEGKDVEEVLIHELLHIVIEGHINAAEDTPADVNMERAINTIAGALRTAYRGRKK